MAAAACIGPSFWDFSTNIAGRETNAQCRATAIIALCSQQSSFKYSYLNFKRIKASWSARPRQPERKNTSPFVVYGVERLGLEPFMDRKCSQKDGSAPEVVVSRSSLDSTGWTTTSEESEVGSEGDTLEQIDTDSIIFEETSENDNDKGKELIRDRPAEDLDNGEFFAAEEALRPLAGRVENENDFSSDDETGSDSEVENGSTQTGVRRRKAEDVLSFPETNSIHCTPAEKEKVEFLQNYKYRHASERGLFVVESMRPKHMKDTEELLVDSFAELMGGLLTYRPLLALTVKQYVRDRYATLPHSVTLVGLYAPAEGVSVTVDGTDKQTGYWVVAGTVELSFSVSGHPYLPTPAPPANAPYICNMAVRKDYRRRGLGREMLKAAEDLAISMGCQDMYLHCRMVDTAPLNMYREAGYQVIATDSLLAVLTLQRRRHLMRKRLPRRKLVEV